MSSEKPFKSTVGLGSVLSGTISGMLCTTLALVDFSVLRWCLKDESRASTFAVFLEWKDDAPVIHYIQMFLFGILPFQLLILAKEGFIDTFRKTADINRHVCDVIIVVNLLLLLCCIFIRIIPLQQCIKDTQHVSQSMQELDYYYLVLVLQNLVGLFIPIYKFKNSQSIVIRGHTDTKKTQ
jgi:hypothetical protein